jgi:hypothetical protein
MGVSTDDRLLSAFRSAVSNELDDAIGKIRHCVGQLSDDQLWWRPQESMNSIANLILHLTGNARQWIVAGLTGAADHRDRPREFSQRGRVGRDALLGMLDAVAVDVKETLRHATVDDLVVQRRIQGFQVTGMQAVIESISHFRGHTQEITHLTRIQLDDTYRFDFVPRPDQQGGAAS